jgi:hypothetical protein
VTHAELDALPDITPKWGSDVRAVNGFDVLMPVLLGSDAALYMGDQDGSVTDSRDGSTWIIGWIDGKRVKRRAPVF